MDAGAQITDLGSSHGLRSVVARNGQDFRIMHIAPDGRAAVTGLITEMSPGQLLTLAGGQVKELGTAHGLRGLFVINGKEFQVFYVTPDGERVIPGVMSDGTGKNITREQVAPISGAIATVEVGPGSSGMPVEGARPGQSLPSPLRLPPLPARPATVARPRSGCSLTRCVPSLSGRCSS